MSKKASKKKVEFSKQLIKDIRGLLWIVTVGALVLAGVCIYRGYVGSLPWLSAMVGLPWSAHGIVCSFYLNMSKSDHREGGITFETARARQFQDAYYMPQTPYVSTYTPMTQVTEYISINSPKI